MKKIIFQSVAGFILFFCGAYAFTAVADCTGFAAVGKFLLSVPMIVLGLRFIYCADIGISRWHNWEV